MADHIDVRLNVFLDDIVRHQIGDPDDHDVVSAENIQKAVRQHSVLLLSQLRIFDAAGRPLTAEISAVPKWTPTSDEVKLSENNLLKLTWNLRYHWQSSDSVEAPRESTSLCFLHSFTHATLIESGELRLHLQHRATGKRIDAVLPPDRAHTIVLPGQGKSAGDDVNTARSQIVVSAAGIVHEFTAPLALLDIAWPPALEFRKRSQASTAGSSPVSLAESSLEEMKQQLASWMQTNVVLHIGGRETQSTDVTVVLFAAGESPDPEDGEAVSQGGDLPFYGTQVGVRLRHSPSRSADDIGLLFLKSPGELDELIVEVIAPSGETSELVPFAPSTDGVSPESALEFAWNRESAILLEYSTESHASRGHSVVLNPVTVSQYRPGTRGMIVGAFCLLFFSGWGFARRRSLSTGVVRSLFAVGVLSFVSCLALIPGTRVSVNDTQLQTLTQQMLTHVYLATMLSSDTEAVSSLSAVLEEDLVEDIYLAMQRSLASSSDDGLLVNVADVQVSDVKSERFQESPDLLRCRCEWTVRGTVYHWGHRHPRELSLFGDIVFANSAKGWKLRSIIPTDVQYGR